MFSILTWGNENIEFLTRWQRKETSSEEKNLKIGYRLDREKEGGEGWERERERDR